MIIRWHFNEGPLQSVVALEIDGQTYTREEIEQIVTAYQSNGEAKVCGNGAHRITGAFCAVPGCGQNVTGRSPYCKKHDMRVKRHGDPTVVLRAWDRKKQEGL